MKFLLAALFAVLALILMQACIGGTPSTFPRETSFKEASSVMGVELPRPLGLPEGYTIGDVVLLSQNEVSVTIIRSISGEVTLSINWLKVPLKLLDATKVDIDGHVGYFYSRTDDNLLKWNLLPPVQPVAKEGLFELTLIASKTIPTGEFLLIAESVGW